MVTRNLTPNDFGLWTLIGSLVSYVLIIEPIISYWTTRQTSRGEKVGKTALTTSGFFSVGGIIAYIGIAFFVHFTSNTDFNVLALASLLIPLSFLTYTLTGVSLGFRPQAISFGIVGFEIAKIPMGIIFVIVLQMGISGAILATVIALLVKMFILLIYCRKEILGKFKTNIIKFWFKLAWLPIYFSSSGLLHKFDILIFTILTNSFLGPAFWGVSISASSIVGQSINISQGLYPKLIATQQKEIAKENLKRTLFFTIPFFATSVLFAKPILHILNPLYVDATFIVYLFAIRSLLNVPLQIFYGILQAYEKVDLDTNASFNKFVKSKLFLVPTLQHLYSAFYIGSLLFFLLVLRNDQMTEIFLVEIWALIQLLVLIPFFFYATILVIRHHKIVFPYKDIIVYSGFALISSIIVFFIMDETLQYQQSIWKHLQELIPIVVLGGIIYFGLAYLFDKSTRNLYKSILNEIRKKI